MVSPMSSFLGLENPLGHVTLQFAQPVRLFVQVLLDSGNYGGRKNGGKFQEIGLADQIHPIKHWQGVFVPLDD